MRRRKDELGFSVTPGLKGEIDALDRLIEALGKAIRASKSPRINAAFREAFAGYERRWETFRGQTVEWQARLMNLAIEERLEQFAKKYDAWQRDYQRRKLEGEALVRPTPAALKDPSLKDLVPPEVIEEMAGGLAWGIAAVALIGAVMVWKG